MEQTRASRPFIRRRCWSWSWGVPRPVVGSKSSKFQGSCDGLTATNNFVPTQMEDSVEKQPREMRNHSLFSVIHNFYRY